MNVSTAIAETEVRNQCGILSSRHDHAKGARPRRRDLAERAYRESLGLTAVEFVDLRRIEVQKEIAQHSPAVLTVIMGLA